MHLTGLGELTVDQKRFYQALAEECVCKVWSTLVRRGACTGSYFNCAHLMFAYAARVHSHPEVGVNAHLCGPGGDPHTLDVQVYAAATHTLFGALKHTRKHSYKRANLPLPECKQCRFVRKPYTHSCTQSPQISERNWRKSMNKRAVILTTQQSCSWQMPTCCKNKCVWKSCRLDNTSQLAWSCFGEYVWHRMTPWTNKQTPKYHFPFIPISAQRK